MSVVEFDEGATDLHALHIAPPSSTVLVHTNSQTAMANYRRFVSQRRSTPCDARLRSPDRAIWESIANRATAQEIQLRVHKVAGHAGILRNEIADRLARSAAIDPEVTLWTTDWLVAPATEFALQAKGVPPVHPRMPS